MALSRPSLAAASVRAMITKEESLLPETAAYKLVVEEGRVLGVRTGDKGLGPDGKPLSNFEPGSDVQARVTVLAEGTQGHLTGAAIR